MKHAALLILGLLHGDMRVPQQRIGALASAGMGQAKAATDQQTLAVHPVRLTQYFGDALGQALHALRIAACIEQQCEFVAAQTRDLIAGLQQPLEPRHHLQDQAVSGLVAEGIIGMTEIVQIEMTQHQATAATLGQARREQGLETLAIGDAGRG